MVNITILGAGNWGTVLALLLHSNGHKVKLWEFFKERVEQMIKTRENKDFLPGTLIPEDIEITNDMKDAVLSADVIILAVPSDVIRGVINQVVSIEEPIPPGEHPSKLGYREKWPIIVSVIKGIENNTLLTVSGILKQKLPKHAHSNIAVLSGPSLANEVNQRLPTAVVVASDNELAAKYVQMLFSNPYFRVYTSNDVIGVELGGALKNVIAIAAGICDGLGLGDNTRGALLTRGLAEIIRLGTVLGANPITFAGLSGMGDLITTCSSKKSRNHYVGEEIGKGRKLKDILNGMVMVAEGVKTAKSAYKLAENYEVDMPITEKVYKILFEDEDPRKAITELMTREVKPEVR